MWPACERGRFGAAAGQHPIGQRLGFTRIDFIAFIAHHGLIAQRLSMKKTIT